MRNGSRVRSLLRRAAVLAAATLVACGGDNSTDFPESPTAFLAVLSPSVALIQAPRVAASVNGDTWLAWAEGDSAQYTIRAARINGVGVVTPSTVVSNVDGTVRDLQITIVGVAPILVWRHFGLTGAVTANAASIQSGSWRHEFASPASAFGDISIAPLPSGIVALSWTRLDSAGRVELVAAHRSPIATWSTPTVIRSLAAGMVLLRSGLASESAGGLMAIWSEAPDASGGGPLPPEALLSSLHDAALDAWGGALMVDAGQHYYSPVIASTANAGWLAAWLSGNPLGITALLAKRFEAGAWGSAADRVDQGQDDRLNELVVTRTTQRIVVGWTGLAATVAPASVRAAAFDIAASQWSAPALVGATQRGFPVSLVLRNDGQATVGAVWSVSQGDGTPLINVSDAAGVWQGASQLDPGGNGLAADLSFFSAGDVATTWYRSVSGGLEDVVARRLR